MYATTQNSVVSAPVRTKVKQRTLPNSENFIAPELHIGQKERKTTRSVADVPLTEH